MGTTRNMGGSIWTSGNPFSLWLGLHEVVGRDCKYQRFFTGRY